MGDLIFQVAVLTAFFFAFVFMAVRLFAHYRNQRRLTARGSPERGRRSYERDRWEPSEQESSGHVSLEEAPERPAAAKIRERRGGTVECA
ncbi:hypothetical protein CDD83_246 [Cordyceps sp. RAO-2017]|nr:hypothetical protein CDD83_246 [Cordyceps sp. RAO-2017]